jgi:TRAP-type C4-dicarboxylate transport system substrate-binding protein
MRPLSTLVALFVALLFGLASAGAETLKIATLAPDGSSWMKEMRQGAEEVKAKTQGRVRFKFYPGGVMGNDKTVLRKIRAGQLQGGAFASGSLVEIYPDMILYGLPFLFRSYAEVDYVRERMDPILREGLTAGGLVPLGIIEGGFVYLASDSPIRGVADAKGKKVWAPEGDRIGQTLLEAAGITPVPLALADVYTGLQTGLVDTVAATPTVLIALQWHTRVRYITDTPIFYVIGTIAVDRGAFAKLSPADQKAVREAMGQTIRRMDRSSREDNDHAREALKEHGIQFLTPSAEELARWREIAAEAMGRLKGKGVYSDENLSILEVHLREFRSRQPGAGR